MGAENICFQHSFVTRPDPALCPILRKREALSRRIGHACRNKVTICQTGHWFPSGERQG